MKNVAPRAYLSRIFVAFSVSFALTLLFAAASVAQTTTSDPLAGETATFVSTDDDDTTAEQITVPVGNCQEGQEATIVVNDPGGNPRTLDSASATFTGDTTQLTIEITDTALVTDLTTGTGTIDRSDGFTCTTADDTNPQNQDPAQSDGSANNQQNRTSNQQNANNDDQGNAKKQYGKPVIIKKTIVKGLPKTGGPSPLLLAWVIALGAAGVAVVRRS